MARKAVKPEQKKTKRIRMKKKKLYNSKYYIKRQDQDRKEKLEENWERVN
jgi:hypothetical protein